MKRLGVIILTLLIATPLMAVDLDINRITWYIDNSNKKEFYVSQMDSEYKPKSSCLAAVGKMVCNILVSDKNKDTVTDIAKKINTKSGGAYITDLNKYLSTKGVVCKIDNYKSINEMNNIIKKSTTDSKLVCIQVDSEYLASLYSDMKNVYTHALLVFGGVKQDGTLYYMVKDPYSTNKTLYIKDKDIYDALLTYNIVTYSKKLTQ